MLQVFDLRRYYDANGVMADDDITIAQSSCQPSCELDAQAGYQSSASWAVCDASGARVAACESVWQPLAVGFAVDASCARVAACESVWQSLRLL